MAVLSYSTPPNVTYILTLQYMAELHTVLNALTTQTVNCTNYTDKLSFLMPVQLHHTVQYFIELNEH